jgi:antitoxin (DNA-binding transcriptional repressor) of toxin-antitoxin stability system
MKTVTFTEFRKNASGLLYDVEGGENLLVLRHGKPVAEISPVSPAPEGAPSWKRRGLRLAASGAALSTAIIEERRGEDVL